MRQEFREAKNPFVRKGSAAILRGTKTIALNSGRQRFQTGKYSGLLVNSFPKSGTHLLSQIVGALPGTQDRGEFIASTPSITMRRKPDSSTARRLSRTLDGEVVMGHLFWSEAASSVLQDQGIASYFIYRDPRDVVVSEARYLTYMNKWHRMSRSYRALPDDDERLMLSILGSRDGSALEDYPDIAARFSHYQGWISDPSTLSMRFEDLRGPALPETVKAIVVHYLERSSGPVLPAKVEAIAQDCMLAIDPRRSHTFRKSEPGGWREHFSSEHIEAFKQVAGDLLVRLNYERDLSW
ncbi:sulfotransferase domain-containing protein [Nocardioides cremeus]|uniref:sulfotransferase domain-containing protein n=1 Tax=Nocardioides cremeus TaxID=3058044 RepID=UPI0034E01F52